MYNLVMAIILNVPTVFERQRIPEEVIQEVVHRIIERFNPCRIILFGSHAYGTPRPESDLDLLVEMETDLRESEQALLIRQYLKPLFGLDLLVYTPARLRQRLEWGDSFLREIIERGIVLYESIDT